LYEVLAFGGSDGDTLCIWAAVSFVAGDGFGVFTMPQEEMAVCSIILCIYLGDPGLVPVAEQTVGVFGVKSLFGKGRSRISCTLWRTKNG
jgi:hypothetical protein